MLLFPSIAGCFSLSENTLMQLLDLRMEHQNGAWLRNRLLFFYLAITAAYFLLALYCEVNSLHLRSKAIKLFKAQHRVTKDLLPQNSEN